MSEKKYETTMTDIPRPPRSQPTSARAKSTSAFDMPQRSMTVPAKMKLGIASRIQFCEAPIRLDATMSSECPPSTRPSTAAAPSANTIGIDNAIRTTNSRPVEASSISVVPGRGNAGLLQGGFFRARHLERGKQPVDHDQATAHRRRGIEPGKAQFERRRGQHPVRSRQPDSLPAGERAEPGDHQVRNHVNRPLQT